MFALIFAALSVQHHAGTCVPSTDFPAISHRCLCAESHQPKDKTSFAALSFCAISGAWITRCSSFALRLPYQLLICGLWQLHLLHSFSTNDEDVLQLSFAFRLSTLTVCHIYNHLRDLASWFLEGTVVKTTEDAAKAM